MLRYVAVPITTAALCLLQIRVAAQEVEGSPRWASVESVALASITSRDPELLPSSAFARGAPAPSPTLARVTAYATTGALLGTAAGVGLGSLMVGDDKGFACENCGPMLLLGLAGNLAGVSAGAHLGAGQGPTPAGAALGLLAGFLVVGATAWQSPWVSGLVGITVQGLLTAKSALGRTR